MFEQINLTDEILKLRNAFHATLALKRDIKTNSSEVNNLTKEMNDIGVQTYLERPYEFRRWLQFFRRQG